ncbi:DNA-binding transcriptional LysR family regulator [Roseimicrobium gellanilyticum]|uniref:DNA-binding transcriptional LysR family regulator n=1 Tax=Roseimicrobium gellanilyticum TaxID=748857 RepID=A0A366HP78_9BACT|nr:LysR family transcriptional regulator [Roseimicrobium gellanilyticum]RBP44385.1 DNA-binding transcriptional LysR family regulator [Roseimicrobium gellanilyticum]
MAAMELRHLRYFQAVAEALNFTKAAAQLRVAQPALSRQVQDLEDEIGVDLLVRSPRGVALTAEGKLFLAEVKDLLTRADEAVEKVRALARGEYGELHVGYAPTPTSEILPRALASFQEAAPRVHVVLHDLAGDEMYAGLREGALHLAITAQSAWDAPITGVAYEELRQYPFCVALAPGHRFAKLKAVSLAEVASEPLVALRKRDYSEYHVILDRIFAPSKLRLRIAAEVDGANTLITGVESGRGVAVVTELFRGITGDRLLYRPITGCPIAQSVGIATAAQGDITPAGEKFREVLRDVAKGLGTASGRKGTASVRGKR